MSKGKYFTIHENDASTEVYHDWYVQGLEAENAKQAQIIRERNDERTALRDEIKRLKDLCRQQQLTIDCYRGE